jgi:hypothetical protein
MGDRRMKRCTHARMWSRTEEQHERTQAACLMVPPLPPLTDGSLTILRHRGPDKTENVSVSLTLTTAGESHGPASSSMATA